MSLKNKLKEFGQKAILAGLISYYSSKANQSTSKAAKYRRKAERCRSRLEEITRTAVETIENQRTTKGYHDSMEEFYQKYEARNDNVTKDIGKILAGDYIENGGRIWYWKDRVRKVKEYLGDSQLSESIQKQIFAILKNNRYFMSKKLHELSELNNSIFRETGINRDIREYLSNRIRPPTIINPPIINQPIQEPTIPSPRAPEPTNTPRESNLERAVERTEEAIEVPQTTQEVIPEREEVTYNGKLATLPSKGDLIIAGEIKGNLEDFNKTLEKFEEGYMNNNKTYLLLPGNYLKFEGQNDGPSRISFDSIKILDQLIELKKKYKDNIISLIGRDELLHYQRDAVHGSVCAWNDYTEGANITKEQIENHAKFLNEQPIAAQIPNKFLFATSGDSEWVKTLEYLLHREGELPKRNDRSQNEPYSENAHITTRRRILDSLRLKEALYMDRNSIFGEVDRGREGAPERAEVKAIRLNLSEDYKSLHDCKSKAAYLFKRMM